MKALATLSLAAAVALAAFSPALAEMKKFSATLAGSQEVPSNNSAGTGMAEVEYDAATQQIKWTVTYSGLSGPLTAAHFHGPADPGENAGPMVTIQRLDAELQGTAELSKEQEAALNDGKMYINLHTAQFPDGEIRGQLMAN